MSPTNEIRRLLCSDDRADQERARRLARGSDELAAVVDAHDELRASILEWKAEAQAPAALRQRIVAQVRSNEAASAETAAPSVAAIAARERFGWRLWSWQGALAAAATLVFVVVIARTATNEPTVLSASGRLMVADALAAAHDAEKRHAAAIAELQRAAEPILGRAQDRRTSAAEAALLLTYRDRLSAIDTAIAEVTHYLDDNPGLVTARTILLAAYIDKTRLLEEILGRNDRGELG